MLVSVNDPQKFVESEVAENAVAGAIAVTAGVDAVTVDVTMTVASSRRLGDAAIVAAGRRLQKGQVDIQYTISVTEEMAASINVNDLQEDLTKVTEEVLTREIVNKLTDLGETSFTVNVMVIEDPQVLDVSSPTPSTGPSPTPEDDLDSHCARLAPFGIMSVALLLMSLSM